MGEPCHIWRSHVTRDMDHVAYGCVISHIDETNLFAVQLARMDMYVHIHVHTSICINIYGCKYVYML